MNDGKVLSFADAVKKRFETADNAGRHLDMLNTALPVMQRAVGEMRQLGCTDAEIISTLQTAAEILSESQD